MSDSISSSHSDIIVLGAGMAGLASAIAISKSPAFSASPPHITIYELRPTPSTIGGAVNLTPSALRSLDSLGVLAELRADHGGCDVGRIQMFSLHTGSSLGDIDYRGPQGKGFNGYRGMRVMRSDLLYAMLKVAASLENVRVEYGKKATAFHEGETVSGIGNEGEHRAGPEDGEAKATAGVHVSFEDGTSATGALLLGCDGIHSSTRMGLVEMERTPEYSGIASAYGFVGTHDVLGNDGQLFFEDTALGMSRYGALLMTFCDEARKKIYLAALMETPAQLDKQGWRARGEDKEALGKEIVDRFQDSTLPKVKEMLATADDWFLYPIYTLPPGGKWYTERALLLGDAAHAMPPRGESIAYALEDAIIFSCILAHFGLPTTASSPKSMFTVYEHIRRAEIERAYKDASWGWNKNKDSGYLATKLMEWITPVYLWWSRKKREEGFVVDPRDIVFPDA